MASKRPANTTGTTPDDPTRIEAEQRLAAALWPPVPGLEWVDDDGRRLTTLSVPTSKVRPEWMRRFRIDSVVSRPVLLRWLHDEARQCEHAWVALNLLVDSARHFDPPGYRNPTAVLEAVLAVLEGARGLQSQPGSFLR